MINFIKRDFKVVRGALGCLVGKEIPFGIALLYYTIIGILILPLIPFVMLYNMIMLRRLLKGEA